MKTYEKYYFAPPPLHTTLPPIAGSMRMIAHRLVVFTAVLLASVIVVGCVPAHRPNDDSADATPARPSLPPGVARVIADVEECTELEQQFDCSLRVKRVLGYGPSTRPLAPGDFVRTVWKKSHAAGRSSYLLSEGAEIDVEIRISQIKGDAEQVWEIAQIN